MTQDRVRNHRYQLAIEQICSCTKYKRWLEVGPGAHATLTRMVLEADDVATVLAIEGNRGAVPSALQHLKEYASRAEIVVGLSSDEEVERALLARKPPHSYVFLQEVLGMLASSEGICAIIGRLHATGLHFPALVPCRAATFCAPALLQSLSSREEVYVAPNSFALVRALKIGELWAATQGSGPAWTCAGLFEFLDFGRAATLMQVQTREVRFRTLSEARVNGLSTWIWCETAPQGRPRNSRFAQTAYPYGSEAAPPRSAESLDFSSRGDDDGAAASAWRNVLFPFATTETVPAGGTLVVNIAADLRTLSPTYHVRVSVERPLKRSLGQDERENCRTVFETFVSNFYPVFSAPTR